MATRLVKKKRRNRAAAAVPKPYNTTATAYARVMKQASYSSSIRKKLTRELTEGEKLLKDLYNQDHPDFKKIESDAYGIRLISVPLDPQESSDFLDEVLGPCGDRSACVGCYYNVSDDNFLLNSKFAAMQSFIYRNIDHMPMWKLAMFAHAYYEDKIRSINRLIVDEDSKIPYWSKRSIYTHFTSCIHSRQIETFRRLEKSRRLLTLLEEDNLVFADVMELSRGVKRPRRIVREAGHKMYLAQLKMHLQLEDRWNDIKQNAEHDRLFPNGVALEELHRGEKINSKIYQS